MSRFLSTLIPNLRRLSISATSASGSTTTPFPITQTLPRRKIPDGIRWRIYLTPRWMTVCPALLPPWLRTTISARAVSTSMILPLPSSPHCIPIKIVFGIEIRNGQKIFPMHPVGHSRDLPTDNKLARSPRNNFRGFIAFGPAAFGCSKEWRSALLFRCPSYSAGWGRSSPAVRLENSNDAKGAFLQRELLFLRALELP